MLQLISDHGPVCLSLQKTYLKIRDTVTFRGFSCFRKDFYHSSRAKGGIAILVSNIFAHSPVPLNTDLQALAVQATLLPCHTIAIQSAQSISNQMIIFNSKTSIILLRNFLPLLYFLGILTHITLFGVILMSTPMVTTLKISLLTTPYAFK